MKRPTECRAPTKRAAKTTDREHRKKLARLRQRRNLVAGIIADLKRLRDMDRDHPS